MINFLNNSTTSTITINHKLSCNIQFVKKNLCTEEKHVKCDLHSRIPKIKSLHSFFCYFCTHSITVLVYDHSFLIATHITIRCLHNIKSIKKIFAYWMRILKKITKKCRYFPKILCILGFLQMKWNVKGVNKILVIKWSFLRQQVSLYFSTKMPGKQVSKNIIQLVDINYYKGKSAKEIADMFSLKIRNVYNIIPRAEEEGWLDLKGSTGRPKKVRQRFERKIVKAVYDIPQSSVRG